MKKRKRILSMLLAVVMVVCMLPVSVSAADYTISQANFVPKGTLGSTEDMLQWSDVGAPGGYMLLIMDTDSKAQVYYAHLDKNSIKASEVLIYSGNFVFTAYALDANGNELSNKTSDQFSYTSSSTVDVHTHCACGSNTNIGDHTSHENMEFIPWISPNRMPILEGNYVLMNDVNLLKTWTPVKNTVLCLNGYTLNYTADERYTVRIEDGNSLTICDCSAAPGTITGSDVINVVSINNANFTMYNGRITGATSYGVHAGGTGVVKLLGGTITGNSSGFYPAAATNYIGGNIVIADNQHVNVEMGYSGGNLLTVLPMSEAASIGVSFSGSEYSAFSSGGAEYIDQFFSDREDFEIQADGNNLKFVESHKQTCSCVDRCDSQNIMDSGCSVCTASGNPADCMGTPILQLNGGVERLSDNNAQIGLSAAVNETVEWKYYYLITANSSENPSAETIIANGKSGIYTDLMYLDITDLAEGEKYIHIVLHQEEQDRTTNVLNLTIPKYEQLTIVPSADGFELEGGNTLTVVPGTTVTFTTSESGCGMEYKEGSKVGPELEFVGNEGYVRTATFSELGTYIIEARIGGKTAECTVVVVDDPVAVPDGLPVYIDGVEYKVPISDGTAIIVDRDDIANGSVSEVDMSGVSGSTNLVIDPSKIDPDADKVTVKFDGTQAEMNNDALQKILANLGNGENLKLSVKDVGAEVLPDSLTEQGPYGGSEAAIDKSIFKATGIENIEDRLKTLGLINGNTDSSVTEDEFEYLYHYLTTDELTALKNELNESAHFEHHQNAVNWLTKMIERDATVVDMSNGQLNISGILSKLEAIGYTGGDFTLGFLRQADLDMEHLEYIRHLMQQFVDDFDDSADELVLAWANEAIAKKEFEATCAQMNALLEEARNTQGSYTGLNDVKAAVKKMTTYELKLFLKKANAAKNTESGTLPVLALGAIDSIIKVLNSELEARGTNDVPTYVQVGGTSDGINPIFIGAVNVNIGAVKVDGTTTPIAIKADRSDAVAWSTNIDSAWLEQKMAEMKNATGTNAAVRAYKVLENGTLEAKEIKVKQNADGTLILLSALSNGNSTYVFLLEPVKADVDDTPTTPEVPSSPQTGDYSHMWLWVALLFVSGAGLVGTTIYGRKRRTN